MDNGLKLYLLDYPMEDIKFIFEQIYESVAEQVTQSQEYLLELNTFIHFSNFLLGKNIDIRRWNLGQAKEFSITHETISTLALAAIENKKSK
ncbi:unnamed protein product [Rotaria socialis]|uniref:Uncharacterized protein n=1 Tax=Rotaria socialis TaxID=392032 RepID=A0A822BQD1_9BILA|nr:unnamed protein product [Rotaria socialis]